MHNLRLKIRFLWVIYVKRLTPTTEFSDINSEEGEIALCMLGGINLEF
jgi:hypothetical protein